MKMWNDKNLPLPPIATYKCSSKDIDIQYLRTVCLEAKQFYEDKKYMYVEYLLLSRIVYRMKTKFRSSKDFKAVEKLYKTLDSYFKINMPLYITTFTELIPNTNQGNLYMPTKNLIDYILVRQQGLVKLLERLVETSKIAAHLLQERVHLGHMWMVAFLLFAITARLYVLGKFTIEKTCNYYQKLLPFSGKLKNLGVDWLPQGYRLPNNLRDWLNVDWLEFDDEVQFIEEPPELPEILHYFDLVDDDDDIQFCDEYIILDGTPTLRMKKSNVESNVEKLRGFDLEDMGEVIQIDDTVIHNTTNLDRSVELIETETSFVTVEDSVAASTQHSFSESEDEGAVISYIDQNNELTKHAHSKAKDNKQGNEKVDHSIEDITDDEFISFDNNRLNKSLETISTNEFATPLSNRKQNKSKIKKTCLRPLYESLSEVRRSDFNESTVIQSDFVSDLEAGSVIEAKKSLRLESTNSGDDETIISVADSTESDQKRVPAVGRKKQNHKRLEVHKSDDSNSDISSMNSNAGTPMKHTEKGKTSKLKLKKKGSTISGKLFNDVITISPSRSGASSTNLFGGMDTKLPMKNKTEQGDTTDLLSSLPDPYQFVASCNKDSVNKKKKKSSMTSDFIPLGMKKKKSVKSGNSQISIEKINQLSPEIICLDDVETPRGVGRTSKTNISSKPFNFLSDFISLNTQETISSKKSVHTTQKVQHFQPKQQIRKTGFLPDFIPLDTQQVSAVKEKYGTKRKKVSMHFGESANNIAKKDKYAKKKRKVASDFYHSTPKKMKMESGYDQRRSIPKDVQEKREKARAKSKRKAIGKRYFNQVKRYNLKD